MRHFGWFSNTVTVKKKIVHIWKLCKVKYRFKVLKKLKNMRKYFSPFSHIWMWYLITGASDVRRSRSRCRRQIKIMSIKVYKEVFLAAFSVWNDDVLCMFSSIRKYCSPSKINLKKSLQVHCVWKLLKMSH